MKPLFAARAHLAFLFAQEAMSMRRERKRLPSMAMV
jgi:hypothetical protein